MPERIQKEAAPAACSVRSRSQPKSFLFLLEEKNRRAQIKNAEKTFLRNSEQSERRRGGFIGWGFRQKRLEFHPNSTARLKVNSIRMIIDYIVSILSLMKKDRPILVAVDGACTAGKSTLANGLAEKLVKDKQFIPVRISLDKFHNPKVKRYLKGELSPEGYFLYSFNYEQFLECVVDPVRHNAQYLIPGVYDYKEEKEITPKRVELSKNSIVIVDGLFLHRDELHNVWDLSIYLDVTPETVINRALIRDLPYFGSEDNLIRKHQQKYIPGQKLYTSTCKPHDRAHIVVNNNDFNNPSLVKSWGK